MEIKQIMLITVLIISIVSCRGDKDYPVTDGRVEPQVEMDLGPDNIGDEHLVDDDGFSEYDYDVNNYWDENEWNKAYEEEPRLQIAVEDKDGDGALNTEEFARTTFKIVDTDNNELISEYEWDVAYQYMFHMYTKKDLYQTYTSENHPELIIKSWENFVKESGWFRKIDSSQDGEVQLEEWKAYLFERWDYDNNGYLSKSELNLYLDFYGEY